MQFFCIIVFWHCSDCVYMCIAQLFVRFLAWFLAFLVLCVHSLVLLIFCNRFVNYLIVFFCQINQICIFCFFADESRCHLLDLRRFLSFAFRFFCVDVCWFIALCKFALCFVFLKQFLCFIALILYCDFVLWFCAVHTQFNGLFCFFCIVFFFCFPCSLLIYVYSAPRTPHFPSIPFNDPAWSTRPSLFTLCFFWPLACIPKYVLWAHLGLFLPCFPSPPCPYIQPLPYKPVTIDLHAVAHLCA